MEKMYVSNRIIDGKIRRVIVNETGKIINKNPSKDELKDLKQELYKDKRDKYTDQELLDYPRQFYEKYGRSPTIRDFDNNPDYPSSKTCQNRFGNWNDTLKFAGLCANIYKDEDLLDDLKTFYYENGRPPTARDFDNNHKYANYGTYQRRFGSWSDALKLVELDIESMVKKGVLETNQQKARLAEMIVRDHFKTYHIDLAGENCNSPWDGICPNGMNYDVKSSKLYNDIYWSFKTNNKYKKEIEIYYFLAFNKDYTELMYGWRVSGEIVGEDKFRVGLNPSYKFDVEDMEDYDITDKIKDILSRHEQK